MKPSSRTRQNASRVRILVVGTRAAELAPLVRAQGGDVPPDRLGTTDDEPMSSRATARCSPPPRRRRGSARDPEEIARAGNSPSILDRDEIEGLDGEPARLLVVPVARPSVAWLSWSGPPWRIASRRSTSSRRLGETPAPRGGERRGPASARAGARRSRRQHASSRRRLGAGRGRVPRRRPRAPRPRRRRAPGTRTAAAPSSRSHSRPRITSRTSDKRAPRTSRAARR